MKLLVICKARKKSVIKDWSGIRFFIMGSNKFQLGVLWNGDWVEQFPPNVWIPGFSALHQGMLDLSKDLSAGLIINQSLLFTPMTDL